MRRLSLTLIAGLLLLPACTGGYAFNGTNSSGNISSVVFTNGSGQVNDYFLSPNGTTPLQVNAEGIHGSGLGSTVVPDTTFTWSAAFAPSGTTYSKGPSPNGSGTCGAPAQIVPQYYTLLQQGPVPGPPVPAANPGPPLEGTAPSTTVAYASPMFVGYNLLPPGQPSPTVYVGPPLDPKSILAADLTATGVYTSATPIGGSNYCLTLVATHVGNDNVKGSITVVVSNAP